MADQVSTLAAYDAWLAEVQAIGTSPPPPPPPVGVRIRVTASAKVRANPVQSDPGVPGSPQPVGALGTVKAGTVLTAGYWNVVFDSGPPGWVWAQNIVIL